MQKMTQIAEMNRRGAKRAEGREKCQDCARCCICIAFTFHEWECWKGLAQRPYRLLEADGVGVPEGRVLPLTATHQCVFVTAGKRCVIYEQRPDVCRRYSSEGPQDMCPWWGGPEPDPNATLRFRVDGEPKGRVHTESRAVAGVGRTIARANQGQRDWFAAVHWTAISARNGARWKLAEGPVVIGIEFVMPRKAKRRRGEEAEEQQHIEKPDVDNLLKPVKDILSGLLWVDDCQVIGYYGLGADPRILKRWAREGEQGGMEIEVEAIG